MAAEVQVCSALIQASSEVHPDVGVSAGNIGDSEDTAVAVDLETPTLKAERYTTGRGGTGNMAKNDPDNPELARASQDVDLPPHRLTEGPQHSGRGLFKFLLAV